MHVRRAADTLFQEVGPKFATRPGGYTRILRTGHRKGDGAEMARIELIDVVVAQNGDKAKSVSAAAKAVGEKAAGRQGRREKGIHSRQGRLEGGSKRG